MGKEAIGIFGGSFNPVHKGHLAIAGSFLDSGYISELWVLLTPDPPHKEGEELVSYRLRFRMLQEVFDDWEQVRVSDLETDLPKPSYTLQTLQYLTEKYPDKSFYLCIGGDSARHFIQWHRWREILSYCKLLVARRSTEELELDSTVAENAHIIDHEPVPISSTEIRNKISEGEDISELVPSEVEDLIHTHNLYQKN